MTRDDLFLDLLFKFHLPKTNENFMFTSHRELYDIMNHMHINNITTNLLVPAVLILFLAYYQFHLLIV
jgi:hypothetical protein